MATATVQAVTAKAATTRAAVVAIKADMALWTAALLITATTAVPAHVRTIVATVVTRAVAVRVDTDPLTKVVTRTDISPDAAIVTETWTETKLVTHNA